MAQPHISLTTVKDRRLFILCVMMLFSLTMLDEPGGLDKEYCSKFGSFYLYYRKVEVNLYRVGFQ